MLGCQKYCPYVFASDELAIIKRAAARDLEKIPRPDDDDFVSSRALDCRRHAPGASFDDVDSAVEVIPFATLAKGPADTARYR